MADLSDVGTSGGVGTIIGAVMTFFGMKYRLNNIEKRMDRVVFTDVFKQCQENHNQSYEDIKDLLKENRDDIKKLLER